MSWLQNIKIGRRLTLGFGISILMLAGSVPDYVQGCIKLFWVLTGKARPAQG